MERSEIATAARRKKKTTQTVKLLLLLAIELDRKTCHDCTLTYTMNTYIDNFPACCRVHKVRTYHSQSIPYHYGCNSHVAFDCHRAWEDLVPSYYTNIYFYILLCTLVALWKELFLNIRQGLSIWKLLGFESFPTSVHSVHAASVNNNH